MAGVNGLYGAICSQLYLGWCAESVGQDHDAYAIALWSTLSRIPACEQTFRTSAKGGQQPSLDGWKLAV
jgi:hypothetical protein